MEESPAMNPRPHARLAPWVRARRIACALSFGLLVTSPALGQDVPLPTPQVSVVGQNERVEVTWNEIAPNEGRRVVIDSLVNWSDSSSTVELVGDYVGECDYRVFVQRLGQVNAFGVHLRLVARLFDQEVAVGTPLAIDTLEVFEPNVGAPFSSAVAPNVAIRFSPNVNPASPLGTIPVTVGGLNTNVARSSTYAAIALNTVSSFPSGLDSLIVKVAGPTTENDTTSVPPASQRVDTLVVRSTNPNEVFPIFNGMTISFGSGAAAAGDSSKWSARHAMSTLSLIQIDLEAYEGYHIWRSDIPDLEHFTLLGEIRVCTSKTELALIDEENEEDELSEELVYDPNARVFKLTDFDVHNDFPFRYAVTTFDRGFLGNPFGLVFEGVRVPSPTLYPGQLARDATKEVYVVPNPYVKSADWEEGEPKVVFTNLPTSCTIRVFTESAEHLATILHGPDQSRSTSATTVTWNLKSESGRDIVPGVYIYYVEAPSFQQTGKMMVVR
jgi:hypothetical protein